jgi:hypothetical protein
VLQTTIEGRQRQADKIEKNIKNARVCGYLQTFVTILTLRKKDNWEPALQTLVTSIGKKFSAAFDRAFSTLR